MHKMLISDSNLSNDVKSSLSFNDFSLSKCLIDCINALGYTTPTSIQSQAIPAILSKSDVLASAQTGSGKTAAFAIPTVQNLLEHASDSSSPAKHLVRGLILAPTRELAQQIYDVFLSLIGNTPLKIALLLGGESMPLQKQSLQKGVDIVIATIGRLYDHVNVGNIKLNKVEILILDEADRMLDMGFLPDLEKIFSFLPQKRQTLLFSATFSDYIKKLTHNYQTNPIIIQTHITNSSNINIKQNLYIIQEYQRLVILKKILQDNEGQCIIFTNSKIDCKKLQQQLVVTYEAIAIHGDMTQAQRTESLNMFKENKIRILVATDVAARGLDVPLLPLVINYNLPFQAEDYIHRIGRTGRAGMQGLAISLCSPKEEANKLAIEKLIGHSIEEIKLTTSKTKVENSNLNSKYVLDKYTRGKKVQDCALFRLKSYK
jgi:ATP-dependent RNA helicase RhlE